VYYGGIFNCLNKFNKPYLHTLTLTEFLLEFINQPIRLGGQSDLFRPAQLFTNLKLRQGTKFQAKKEGWQKFQAKK
jgi:hypothetical protein